MIKTNDLTKKYGDLFAIREPDVGAVKDRSAPPPSLGFTGIGAREENSVLFRVDQLGRRPNPIT